MRRRSNRGTNAMLLIAFDEFDEGGGSTSGFDEAVLEEIFG